MNGSREVSCQADGMWSPSPTCQIVDCGLVPSVDNALALSSNYDTIYNSTFNYTCDTGYTLRGNNVTKCQANGNWSETPTCEIVNCGEPTNISNAVYSAGVDPALFTSQYGKYLEYECDTGYNMSGNATVMCQANGEWSQGPVCQIVNCGDVTFVGNSSYNGSTTTYNSRVNFSCNTGFNMTGHDVIYCQGNGTWTPTPKCNIIHCGSIPYVVNGSHSNSTTHYGSSVAYTCNESIGAMLFGSETIHCLANGTWSTPPECIVIDCDQPPEVPNAIHQNHADTSLTTAGYSVVYTCNEGYYIVGNQTIQCQLDGNWTQAPYCEVINCGPIPNVPLAVHSGNSTVYNSNVTYSCEKGTFMVPNRTAIITCQANGDWSQPPECEVIDCGVVPNVTNAIYSSNSTTIYQSSVTYSCNIGTRSVGNLTIECPANGTWTQSPTCTVIYCGSIPNVSLAMHSGNSTVYNSNVTYSCEEGTLMVPDRNPIITCQANGNWSQPPECEVIDCGVVPNVTNATYSSNSTRIYKSSGTYTCDVGTRSTGNLTIECQANGTWTQSPTCTVIDCGFPQPIVHGNFSIPSSTKYGSSAEYFCKVGYTLEGNSTVSCLESGAWSGELRCRINNCGTPPLVTNASYDSNLTTYGSLVNYMCDEGYEMQGERTINCTANSIWTPVPTCQLVDCGNIPEVSFSTNDRVSTTYESIVKYECLAGFIQSGYNIISCQANGTWSSNGPTCTVTTTTTPAPTLAPCTEEIQYMQHPEDEPNITVTVLNSTNPDDDEWEVQQIQCQDDENGIFKLRVVYGCAKANESAGYIWWDLFCQPRPRRRRPPVVIGPVFVRPKREPQEAPAAAAIGSVEVGFCIGFLALIVILDLVTFSQQLKYMSKNLKTWKDNGFRLPRYHKPAKHTVQNYSSSSQTAQSSSKLGTRSIVVKPAGVVADNTIEQPSTSCVQTRSSTSSYRRHQKLALDKNASPFDIAAGASSSKFPKEEPPPYSRPSTSNTVSSSGKSYSMHIGTNNAVPSLSTAIALRRHARAFRSARSKPAGKDERQLGRTLTQQYQHLHVKPEYFDMPNGQKAKRVYLA